MPSVSIPKFKPLEIATAEAQHGRYMVTILPIISLKSYCELKQKFAYFERVPWTVIAVETMRLTYLRKRIGVMHHHLLYVENFANGETAPPIGEPIASIEIGRDDINVILDTMWLNGDWERVEGELVGLNTLQK